MKIYNTLARAKQDFTPLNSDQVTLYTCGLTVYSQPHIGNWVSYIYWDILERTLISDGYKVKRVQNITDVGHLVSDDDSGEDKMEKGAKAEGKTAWEVADKYIQIAERESNELGLLKPDLFRATDYIKQQIEFVEQLQAKGYTYIIEDEGVYFDTSQLDDYGKLAKLNVDGLEAGARVEIGGKKSPTDFALWKFSPKNQKRDMEWWAPWRSTPNSNEMHLMGVSRRDLHSDAVQGEDETRSEAYSGTTKRALETSTMQRAESFSGVAGTDSEQGKAVHGSWGFPGWHLECSVIANSELGEHIDIHTGGIDHIPVHHTNEIAQSETLFGPNFANYWVHANHIKVDNTKMSKSLGNIFTLEDIKDRGFSLQAFKLLILSKHYRTEGNFTWEILEAAQNRLNNWQIQVDKIWQLEQAEDTLSQEILNALNDDLDTPSALTAIDKYFDDCEQAERAPSQQSIDSIEKLLGLKFVQIDINEAQKELLNERAKARADKNWADSDRIRDLLKQQGIAVNDGPIGQIWYRDSKS